MKMVKMALAWVLIFGAGFVLFSFRDDLRYVGQRLKAEATGAPIANQGEVRIPMGIDGHFWIDGSLNGRPLAAPPLWIEAGSAIEEAEVSRGPRVGISRAVDLPLRFWIRGSEWVSGRIPREPSTQRSTQ